ncbi:MAG: efflux RND transporter permease subunit [Xanthomonadales bacterium]|nr:efflux RND transporter permease subunit [Gammaproteobacteria bacterium]MBT8055104.1 efflux RND transporter permease subunit [Gammaproteobacteria bacterium]NND58407.1 efflux RND transporter permease subunit [Xanthomonadales bacterium]NNK51698.1 efflux RND transporter permease subunit [Xanthomonadales bacterium]
MTLTKISLSNPVAVIVACILIAIFGVISLTRLPIQMTPDISRPEISVSTGWRASAPNEIESEIVEPQEDVLRSIPGLLKMQSSANYGRSNINLQFVIGTDMNRALIEVMNRLNQVPRYPVDAEEPVISLGGENFDKIIAWWAVTPKPGNTRPIESYQDFIDETIITRLERVPGVSQVGSFGGRKHEIRITFDPFKAANIGLDITDVSSRLGANSDVSAGLNEVGRREFTLRFSGKYDINSLGDLVLEWRDGKPVFLRDVARIEKVMVDPTNILHQNGGPSIAINVMPESGVNVYHVMSELKLAVADLAANELENAGLEIEQDADDTVYISASVGMVRNNLMIGITLAVVVLWWFLRKFRATVIVALSIPLCLLMAFMVLDISGRTLNIISLAGLAFATGMVLDAAIVVLENIFRQREAGLLGNEASMRGVSQVWGALLASTATTVAIFMPVIFLENEAGQLFSDLAVTISAAVVASLLVAVTVLPTAAANWIKGEAIDDHHRSWWRWVTSHIMSWTNTSRQRWTWIGVLTISPVIIFSILLPAADYLPEGKKNFIFGFMVTPPGLGVQTAREELVGVIDSRLAPYLAGDKQPQLNNYFLGSAKGWGTFIGGQAVNEDEVDELIAIFNQEIMTGFPDTFGFTGRDPIFGGSRGGRNIAIDLSANSFASLLDAGRAGFFAVMEALPGSNIRPVPGLELAEPEILLIPDDRKIAEAGWNRSDMAMVVRAMGDGAFLGEYFDGSRRYDVVMRAEGWYTPEELTALPVATANGEVLALGELARVTRTAGPSQIRRIDRKRTLTLDVTPPPALAMEEALDIIRDKVAPAIRDKMPADGSIKYRGTAEALDEALSSMMGSFLLAVVILYLLISALFRSFRDSLLVIATIPMATVGGIVALRLVDLALFASGGQKMDLLTMIGFVILLGLVVNNAILLVYRARDAEKEGMSRRDAVESAVRLRLRPILMSTTTSIFGMLPLMLMPGAGTELYRGMASVIVGGMLVSTLFTLILLPSLLRMNEELNPAANLVPETT